jgi:uncharacterized protein YggE
MIAAHRLTLFTALTVATSLGACHYHEVLVPTPLEHAKPGELTVTGQARLDVSPDCADLTMVITADDPRAGAATKQAEAKQVAVVDSLRAQGVDAKDMKLSSLALEPELDYDHGRANLIGYRGRITITVTTRDFAKLPALFDAGSSAGVTEMTSQFRRSDLDQLKAQVRDLAIAAAKQKAAQTARGVGVTLGRVVSVAETPNGAMWSNAYFPNAAAARDTGGALGAMLEPLTLDVTIGYELAPAAS